MDVLPLLPSVRHPSQTAFISANCEPIFIQDFFKWKISNWQPLEDFKEKAPESSVVAMQLCHQFQSLETFGQQINIDCSTTTTTTTVAEKPLTMTTTIESKPATKMTKATFTTDDCCFVCLSTFSKILQSLLLQGSCSRFYELQEESLHLVKFPRGRPIIKAGYCRMMMMVLKRMNLHFGLRSTRQILGVTFEGGNAPSQQIANCKLQ